MDEEFLPIDFSAPLDVEEVIARVPVDVRLSAVFAKKIIEYCRRVGRPVPVERFFHEDTVSMPEMLRFLALAARVLHPEAPLREGLRRIGRLSYATATRHFPTTYFDLDGYLRLIPDVVARAGNHARTSIVVAERRAVLSVDDYRSFREGAMGTIEAALDSLGAIPTLRMRDRGQDAFDLEICWQLTR
ncbi:MAG TPA: hypothetical protein VGO62_14280 [Myxococcota bacterium]|jgi:hypothetical protein